MEATSLNVFDRFERRISWKLRAGATRVVDAGCPGCVAGRLEMGAGPALLARGGALAAAVTADVELMAAPDLRGAGGAPLRPGLGPGVLVRLLAGDRGALLGTAAWRWFPAASPRKSLQFGAIGRLFLGRASLQAEWRRVPLAQEVVLSLEVYGG